MLGKMRATVTGLAVGSGPGSGSYREEAGVSSRPLWSVRGVHAGC